MKKILIGGDFVPTQSNYNYFTNKKYNELFGEKLNHMLMIADYKIFNLEAPITNYKEKLDKEGPNLKISPEVIDGLAKLNINLFSLANNHILDFKEKGLLDTIKFLETNKINYVGAGNNLKEASKGFIFTIGGVRFALYSCTEHEYTIAGENASGANPFDPLISLDDINILKSKVDYLIVLYHGGKEYYPYPSPYLQKVCRRIVEKGADLVLCQHTHCIGTYEKYKQGTILYGQGNFLFDRDDPIHFKEKQTGLLVSLEVNEKNKNVDVSFIPLKKSQEKICLADNEEEKQILEELEERSKKIKSSEFIQENYNKISQKDGGRYLLRLSKLGTILSAIDKRYFKGKIFDNIGCIFTKRQKHTLENMLQCEVHNEIVLNYLKKQK